MNTKLLFATLALPFAMVGCSENNLESAETNPTTDSKNSIEVTIAADPSTRIAIDNSGSSWALSWEPTDGVTAWDGAAFEDFTMTTDGVDENGYAKFEGKAPEGDKVRFVYPAGITTSEINLSAQTVDLSTDAFAHMGKNNLYMMSDAIAAAELESASISMKHLLTFIQLEVKADDKIAGKTIESINVSALGNVAAINFEDGAVSASKNDGITINVAGAQPLVAEQSICLPFSAVPMDLNEGDQFVITVNFTDESSNVVTLAVNAAVAAKDFGRAKYNSLPVYLQGAVEPDPDTTTTVTIGLGEDKVYSVDADAESFKLSAASLGAEYTWTTETLVGANPTTITGLDTADDVVICGASEGVTKVTATSAEGTASCTVVVRRSGAPLLDDYYYKDFTWSSRVMMPYVATEENPVIGIVFHPEYAPKGKTKAGVAYVVSIQSPSKGLGYTTATEWQTKRVTSVDKTGADGEVGGQVDGIGLTDGITIKNMRFVKVLDDDFSDFPLFKYAHDLNLELYGADKYSHSNFVAGENFCYQDVTSNVWFVPAQQELQSLCSWIASHTQYAATPKVEHAKDLNAWFNEGGRSSATCGNFTGYGDSSKGQRIWSSEDGNLDKDNPGTKVVVFTASSKNKLSYYSSIANTNCGYSTTNQAKTNITQAAAVPVLRFEYPVK